MADRIGGEALLQVSATQGHVSDLVSFPLCEIEVLLVVLQDTFLLGSPVSLQCRTPQMKGVLCRSA